MTYVEGFVLAVPTSNKEAYRDMAAEVGKIFQKHGVTQIVECWGRDVPDGKVTSFPMAVKCKPDETVVFSWMVWPSKDARDSGMDTAMKEFEEMGMRGSHLFDGQRMIFGGFDVLFET